MCTLWPAVATAQGEEPAGADAEARQVFELGRRAFEDGRYGNAAGYYDRAFELSHRSDLLYNAGVAYERASRPRDAIARFEQYLETDEAPRRRVEVEERLRVLRAQEGASGADGSPGEEPASTSGGAGVGPWLTVGAGVAIAATGAVFLGVAGAAAANVEDTPQHTTAWADVKDDADRAETFSIAGGVLLGLGVAAAAGGLVWLLSSSGSDGSTAVAVTPGGVVARGAF